jgi:hypothetical protein
LAVLTDQTEMEMVKSGNLEGLLKLTEEILWRRQRHAAE